jgi:acetyl esterase/lipase
VQVGGVRATWVGGPALGARGTLLYLHGGGYVCGKTRTYHNMCGRLAKALNA